MAAWSGNTGGSGCTGLSSLLLHDVNIAPHVRMAASIHNKFFFIFVFN
jgi:hypothetical protein